MSAALSASFFNPLSAVSALAPSSQALTLQTFGVFLHLRHGKGRRVTEPRRRRRRSSPMGERCLPTREDGRGVLESPGPLPQPHPGTSEGGRVPEGGEEQGRVAPGCSAPGRGRAEPAVPAQPGRTEVLRSLPNSPACFSSLPPSPSPHPSPPPRLFPPFSGRRLPESLFSVVLELASGWRRRGAASAGRGGGLGPQPAAHRPDTAGPSGGLTASRPGAPSAHRSALSKLLSSVCARQGWGSVRPARRAGDRRGYLWTGSLDSDQGQLQAQKLLSS